MPFQVSPGINVSEIDLTTVVPAVSTTEGAISGRFRWGPLNERVLVSSENELANRFWKPNNDVANHWFTAASFLAYGNKLYVARVADESTALNATSENTTGGGNTGVGLLIKNDDHYEASYEDGSGNSGQWAAKYPGTLGNSLKVSICPSANAYESTLTGTVSVTANSTTVTGVGTSFTTELVVGDIVLFNSLENKVAAIANTTSLTLATPHATGASANTATRKWEYYSSFDRAPSTTAYATSVGGIQDEMHVVVVDEDGELSATKETVIARYAGVSKASDATTETGASNYYKNVINRQDSYIRWLDHSPNISDAGTSAVNNTYAAPALPETFSLAGGHDGGTPSNADIIRGYDKFKDASDVDVSLIIGADANQTIATHIINNIAEHRKDCIAVISPLRANVVDNEGSEATSIVEYRNTLPSSSYAVMDSGWKYTYDKYNDVFRYVPLNGDTAGTMVRTDNTRDPWFSPAGFTRGQIKNVAKLAYNPGKADRDVIYRSGVNPVVAFPGQGYVLFGDKTLLSLPSAFDRINVRRLFIVLEKAISTASNFLLFEFNDEFTRAQFRNMVEPFLRDVEGRRGIYDFKVVADDTNNTGEVIDRNEFVGDIYIKPARSINYIQLNFVAVRTGVEFSEIVGRS